MASVTGRFEVLITRRKSGTVYAGFWEFPGGKAEPDESAESCVARELREEVGITAEVFGVLSDVLHTYPHASVRLLPRLCRLAQASPEPSPLHVDEVRWVAPEALDQYRFPEANHTIVRELMDALTRGLPGFDRR